MELMFVAVDSQRQTTLSLCLLILSLLTLVGCRDRTSDSLSTPQTTRFDVTVGPEVRPETVEWDAELFTDDALRQLEVLSDLLSGHRDMSRKDLERLVTEECVVARLRPEPLRKVFDDETFTVHRSHQMDSESVPVLESNQTRGIEALMAAIEPSRSQLKGLYAAHVYFKIDRVERDEATVNTRVIYHASGSKDARTIQQNAVWQCTWEQDAALPRLSRIEVAQYEEVESKGATPPFVDVTEAVFRDEPSYGRQIAMSVDHWRARIQAQYEVIPYGHHAIAIGDVNQDGLEDLYACQPQGLPNRLYLRNSDGTLTDGSATWGVDWLDRSRSALLLDFDNDGDQDLVVELDGIMMLMSNEGGRFQERVALKYGGVLAAADFDLDGDLDLYVVNYGKGFQAAQTNSDDVEIIEPTPYHDANNGGANALLRNDGDWVFTDVTSSCGLNHNNARWSLAASWEDYDNDGDPDLYVANDFGRNNLYRNDDGHFVDVAAQLGVEDIAAGMSVSWGDFDADGWMDLYVGNMYSSAGGRIAGQSQFQAEAGDQVRALYRRHARGNSLFKNMGGERFLDVSEDSSVTMGRWAWSSRFVDINNDGREDIIVANGFVTGQNPDDL